MPSLITVSMVLLTLSWVSVSAHHRTARYSIFWPLEPLCSDKCKENGKPFGRLLGTTCSCYCPMMFIPADNNPCDDTVGPSCQRYCQYQGYRGGSCPYNGICFCFCKAKDPFPHPPPPNAVSVLTGLPLVPIVTPPPDGSAVAPSAANLTSLLDALSPISNLTSLLTDGLGSLLVLGGGGGGGGGVAATNATPAAVPDLGENDPTGTGTAAIGAAGAGAGGGIDTGASDTAGADGSSGSQDTIAASGAPAAVATGGTGTGTPAATPGTIATGAAAAGTPAPVDAGAAPAATPVSAATTAAATAPVSVPAAAPAGSGPAAAATPVGAAAAPVTPVATPAADGSSGSQDTVSQSGPPVAVAATQAVPVANAGSSSTGLVSPTPAVPAAPVAIPVAAPVTDLGSSVPATGSAAPVADPVFSRERPTPPLDFEGGVSETMIDIGSQPNLGSFPGVSNSMEFQGSLRKPDHSFGTKGKWPGTRTVLTSVLTFGSKQMLPVPAFGHRPIISNLSRTSTKVWNTDRPSVKPFGSKIKFTGHKNSTESSRRKPNPFSAPFLGGLHSKLSTVNRTNIKPSFGKDPFLSEIIEKHRKPKPYNSDRKNPFSGAADVSSQGTFVFGTPSKHLEFGNSLLENHQSRPSFSSYQSLNRKPTLTNMDPSSPTPFGTHSNKTFQIPTKVNSFVAYHGFGNWSPINKPNFNVSTTAASKKSFQPHPLSSNVPHVGFGSKSVSPWTAASQSFPQNTTKSDSSFTSSDLDNNTVKFGPKPSPWTAASKHFSHNSTKSYSAFTSFNPNPTAETPESEPSLFIAAYEQSNVSPIPFAGISKSKPSPWIAAFQNFAHNTTKSDSTFTNLNLALNAEKPEAVQTPWIATFQASSTGTLPNTAASESKPSPWIEASKASSTGTLPNTAASEPKPSPWNPSSQISTSGQLENAGALGSNPNPWVAAFQSSSSVTPNAGALESTPAQSFVGDDLVPNAVTHGVSVIQTQDPLPPVDQNNVLSVISDQLAQYFNSSHNSGVNQSEILSIINGNLAGLVPGSGANVSNPNAPASTVIMSLGNYSVAIPINGTSSSESNSWSKVWSWSYNSAMEQVSGIQKQVKKVQKYAGKALRGLVRFIKYTALDS